MHSIQFETIVNDNIIIIPDKYKDSIRSGAKVKVVTTVPIENTDNTKTKAKVLSANDFTALQIDTLSFRFNREEANERR